MSILLCITCIFLGACAENTMSITGYLYLYAGGSDFSGFGCISFGIYERTF